MSIQCLGKTKITLQIYSGYGKSLTPLQKDKRILMSNVKQQANKKASKPASDEIKADEKPALSRPLRSLF